MPPSWTWMTVLIMLAWTYREAGDDMSVETALSSEYMDDRVEEAEAEELN